MEEELKKIEPKDFEFATSMISLLTVHVRAGYEFKGEHAGAVIADITMATPPDFENTSYANVKDVIQDALKRLMLTKEYIANSQPLQFNREPFEKWADMTYDEALDQGFLTIRIGKFDMQSTTTVLNLIKKEPSNG